jgi:hypothetical protein
MKNAVVTLAAVAAVVCGLAVPSYAQGAAGTTTMPTFELSAGYQFLRAGEVCSDDTGEEICSSSQNFPLGFTVDAIRNYGALGILGEVGWSRDSDDGTDANGDFSSSSNLFHYVAGIRWTGRTNPRVWPYGQVLAGAITSRVSLDYDSDLLDPLDDSRTTTRFMVQPGVGVTFVTGDGWGVFGQVDYRRIFLDEEDDGASGRNDIRVVIGLRMILD